MNHPPSMPYGQLPIPGGQRRHDMPYSPVPPNMRPQPNYQAYYHPHMANPMAQYPAQYPQQWYPYQQMQHHPPPPPPRQYQHHLPHQHSGHYAPLVVSSYPQPQASQTPAHAQLQSFSQQTPAPAPAPSASPLRPPFSPPPTSITSSTNMQQDTPPSVSSTPSELVSSTVAVPLEPREPFYPPVPWLSVTDQPFPSRAPHRRRKILASSLANEPIVFPLRTVSVEEASSPPAVHNESYIEENGAELGAEEVSIPDPLETITPQTSDAPSDVGSTQPTTPSSAVPTQISKSQQTPTQPRSRVVLPIIPAVPILPNSPTTPRKAHRDSVISTTSRVSEFGSVSTNDAERKSSVPALPLSNEPSPAASEATSKAVSPPAAPKSWADLVRSKAPSSNPSHSVSSAQLPNGLGATKSESLSDVLNTIGTTIGHTTSKIAFLKPRGLVNTGNMCYMNSILQILVFCVPFYELLDQIARKAAHNFRSETPMIDAMIMFMREFSVIDSAESSEHFRLRLKPEDFENFGEAFTPEYVYSVIKQLPRFREMRRGHQQDAQEFLGFLLEELHEECAHAMRSGSSVNSGTSTPIGSASNMSEIADPEEGWMEVGHKQKPAITRSSGAFLTESPVTKIFGGKLRSELKVAGSKNSVTLEPYQPLQLDINSPQIKNVVDALKGLTRPESMQGDFHSARGHKATATKQVFIESLPPILILHLKRFQYDNKLKGTEKIGKKVGYPLELQIPKEVFPTQMRNKMAAHGGVPKYRLTGVIYHHGKNANGGHYTVDIRRQDGREWIRLDDTVIRRIRSEDVAEAGSEEDPKVLAAALEKHKQQKSSSGNMFEQIDQDDEEDQEDAEKMWSQVNGHARSKSTMSAVLNGTSTPSKDVSGHQTPSQKSSIKDNKVAYLLFYQRMST